VILVGFIGELTNEKQCRSRLGKVFDLCFTEINKIDSLNNGLYIIRFELEQKDILSLAKHL